MYLKVHPCRQERFCRTFRPAGATRKASFLLGLLAAVALAGCQLGGSDAEAPGGFGDARFGDAYAIVLGPSDAEPDAPPVLVGDSLIAQVRYAGGCADHRFTLETGATRNDTTRLWLRHDARGDDCEALVRDELRLPVPPEAQRAATVLLLNPQGGPPHVVRWNGER